MKNEVVGLSKKFAECLNARVQWGNGYSTLNSLGLPGDHPIQLKVDGPGSSWHGDSDADWVRFAHAVGEKGPAAFIATVDAENVKMIAADSKLCDALRRGIDMLATQRERSISLDSEAGS